MLYVSLYNFTKIMKTITKVNGNTANRAQGLTKYQKELQESAKRAVTVKAITNQEYKYYMSLAFVADEVLAYSLRHCLDRKYYRKKDQEFLKLRLQSDRQYRRYQIITGQYQHPRIP